MVLSEHITGSVRKLGTTGAGPCWLYRNADSPVWEVLHQAHRVRMIALLVWNVTNCDKLSDILTWCNSRRHVVQLYIATDRPGPSQFHGFQNGDTLSPAFLT